jgi:hypothetical protein
MSLKNIFILLSICLSPLFGQGLTGTFKGELYQNPDKVFYFEIRINKATSDGEIAGTTYIESYGEILSKKGDFGTIDFTGTWKGKSIQIQESNVVKEELKSSSFYWCIKTLKLTYKEEKNELILEGP